MRFKRIIISLFLLLMTLGGVAAEPKISVITIGSGDELYTAFGHTAMRIKSGDQDVICNFGTFNFATPNFYMLFIKGELDYYLSLEEYHYFALYNYHNRIVLEQELNLSSEQKEAVVERMRVLYKPENRAYKYKFIGKNCTTEIRDIVVEVLSETENAHYLSQPSGNSFRNLLDNHLEGRAWTKFGINLLLGSRVDREADNFEAMFLPIDLYKGLEQLSNGNTELVGESVTLFEPEPNEGGVDFLDIFRPEVLLFIVLVLLIIFKERRAPQLIFFSLLGLLGLVLLFLMAYSNHSEFMMNYNVLWCNPLTLIVAIAIWTGKERTAVVGLLLIALSLLAMVVVEVAGVQRFDTSFLICGVALLVATFNLLRQHGEGLKLLQRIGLPLKSKK